MSSLRKPEFFQEQNLWIDKHVARHCWWHSRYQEFRVCLIFDRIGVSHTTSSRLESFRALNTAFTGTIQGRSEVPFSLRDVYDVPIQPCERVLT